MWGLHTFYTISGICVCDSQDSTVDGYRDIGGLKNYTCVQLRIYFNFAAEPLSDFVCAIVMLTIPTSPSVRG